MINFTTTYRPTNCLFDLSRTSIICVLLVLLFGMTQQVVAQQQIIPSINEESNKYPFVWFVDSIGAIQLTDEDFYDNSAKVVFPVNKFDLPKNDKTLQELDQVVLPRINKDSLELVTIVIRGAASPEGPYRWNKVLSERRAKALSDFVKSRLTFIAINDTSETNRNLSQDYDIEDYRSLCIALKKANDPDYDYVKDVCDKYLAKNNAIQLKSTLMKAQQGNLWKKLLRQYFPQLRAARIMLFFRKHKEPEKKEPEKIVPIPVTAPDDSVKTGLVAVRPAPVDTVVKQTLPPTQEEEEGAFLRKKLLAVKTNLLFYGAYIPGYDRWAPIPNIAIEYFPLKGHFTFGASFDMPWWQDYDAHKYFQFRNYQLEARWYAHGANRANKTYNRVYESNLEAYEHNKKAYTGFYLQAYTHLAVFGICFDADRGWVGEGIGAGVGAGYVLPLSSSGRWKLELGLQAGFFRCKYDPYQFENPVNPAVSDGLYYYKWTQKPELFKKRQYRWNWIGPTRIGITLSYDLLYRRIQKNGVSFKSYETYTYKTYKVNGAKDTNESNGTNNPQKERRSHE